MYSKPVHKLLKFMFFSTRVSVWRYQHFNKLVLYTFLQLYYKSICLVFPEEGAVSCHKLL